jgi:hypothetical protein
MVDTTVDMPSRWRPSSSVADWRKQLQFYLLAALAALLLYGALAAVDELTKNRQCAFSLNFSDGFCNSRYLPLL